MKTLAKKYRRIEKDLAEAFALILTDHQNACHARALPGGANALWKYRCGNSDTRSGQSSGYRIIALYVEREAAPTLIPICVYTHDQYASQPPLSELKKWVKETGEAPGWLFAAE